MKKNILSLLLLVNLANADFIRDDIKQIVMDTSTNFMWQDDDETIGDANKKSWSDAISYCEAKTLGGYNDWKLPNFNELYNIADRSIYSLAISPVFQNKVSSDYWSSTTNARYTSYAWVVYFGNGPDYWNNKTDSYFVRCVRLAD